MRTEAEAKFRAALTQRADSIHVDDPNASVNHRVVTLRRRRRRHRRLAVGSFAIATIVAAVALAPVVNGSRHDELAAPSRPAGPAAQPAVLLSHLVRDTRPSVPSSVIDAVAHANTDTAIDLYRQLAKTPGNVFFSPYSVTTALSMAAAGARGDTLSQMLAVLHDKLPTAKFHEATNALNLALLAARPVPKGSNGRTLELEVANSEWSQSGYHVERAFLDLLARDYGAALNTADFVRDSDGATKAINGWVDTNTNHKTKELFDALDPSTRLVLVNAVHFKASWATPFRPEETTERAFSTASGATVTVPFMNGSDLSADYGSGAGWQAVDVPYVGDASMTLIVPDAGNFGKFAHDLDGAEVARIIGTLRPSQVNLSMPKLQLNDQADLVPVLRALGMHDAFTSKADFSGITGNRGLSISQVVHQATVTVDESGTEAAAATGVAFYTSAITGPNVIVDRPYLFLIRDHRTGAILFLGSVADPTRTTAQQP